MGCKCGNPTQDNVTEFKPEAIVSNYITTETLKKKRRRRRRKSRIFRISKGNSKNNK